MSGMLTTAVIDALRGEPANGMLVDLFRLPHSSGERHHLGTIETTDKGTTEEPLLSGDDFIAATYELFFHVGRYFRAFHATAEDPPFLDVVPVRLTISDRDRACHLLLLASPWSYTVFRA